MQHIDTENILTTFFAFLQLSTVNFFNNFYFQTHETHFYCIRIIYYLKILSFGRINSFFGRLYKSVASFSILPLCCRASHMHWMWSGLNSKDFRPISDPNCPIELVDWPFGDNTTEFVMAYAWGWLSFSWLGMDSIIRRLSRNWSLNSNYFFDLHLDIFCSSGWKTINHLKKYELAVKVLKKCSSATSRNVNFKLFQIFRSIFATWSAVTRWMSVFVSKKLNSNCFWKMMSSSHIFQFNWTAEIVVFAQKRDFHSFLLVRRQRAAID